MARGRVLQEQRAVRDERLDAGPGTGLHLVKTFPLSRHQQRRIIALRRAIRQAPARINRRGLLIPVQQRSCLLRAELREPAFHHPLRMRVIRRQLRKMCELGRRLLRIKRRGNLAHHRIDELRLWRARQRLGLFHRMVNHAGHMPLRSAFDQFIASDQQHGFHRGTRRTRQQRRKNRLDPSQMSHRPEKQMLATPAFGTPQRTRQAVEQRVHALVVVQPAHQQLHGEGPCISRRSRLEGFCHAPQSRAARPACKPEARRAVCIIASNG